MEPKYKYFVQTYNQLPKSKHLWDNSWRLYFLIKKMIKLKPMTYPFPDLENSISLHKIDIRQVTNYAAIFGEMLIWNWDTVKPPKKDNRLHINGAIMSVDEIGAKIRQRILDQLQKLKDDDARG